MSNLINFLKSRQTVLEMLRDRKCQIDEHFNENGEYICKHYESPNAKALIYEPKSSYIICNV